jgi:hypothetical protein
MLRVPGDVVDHAHGDQEHRGADQVGDHVLHARLHPQPAAAVHHEAVGGDEQDLEEHEEVEEVAGEEGAVDAHQLELEERVEVLAALVPAADGVEQHAEAEYGIEHEHERRQAVEREDDAEGRGPRAEGVAAHLAVAGEHQQGDGDGEQQHGGGHREAAREHAVVARGQHEQRADHGRQQDGGG